MFVCVALLAVAGSPAGSTQPSETPSRLFTQAAPAASQAQVDAVASSAVPSRMVGVASDRLADERLVIDLFDGRSINARRLQSETLTDGTLTWSGTVDGDPLSAVTFVRAAGLVQGSVRSSAGAYSLEPLPDGANYILKQVDTTTTPPELVPLVPPPTTDAHEQALADFDDGGPIDLLVVYTAAARQQAGGSDAAVRTRIALGVAETNTAFANSGITRRLRLVGTELVGYREAGNLSTDLERLTSVSDGVMDEVHARRQAAGADLVQLVVGSTANGACGVAWVMQDVSVSFAPYAFSVTAYPCISPNYTFGHELAHNFGAGHAPEDLNAPTAFPYAYGYKDPGRRFRTVMAYDCAAGCPRVLHFSNPTVSYTGRPTGTPAHNNNALALNQASGTVAGFKPSRPPSALLSAPLVFRLETQGTTVLLSWNPPSVGSAEGYLVEVGTDEGFRNVATIPVDASTTSLVQADVPPGFYSVRVRAVDAWGPGAPSTSASLRMTDYGRCLVPASAPTLHPATVTGTVAELSWTSPAIGQPVDRYLIAVGTRPQAVDVGVFDTGSALRTFTTDAAPGLYFVRVAGINGCGVGSASIEVAVAVGPPLPGPPTGLVAGIAEDRTVTLTWQRSSAGGAPTGYVIEAGDAPGSSNLAVLPTGSSTTAFRVTAPPGLYHVRVRGVNGAGTSAPSEEIVLLVL